MPFTLTLEDVTAMLTAEGAGDPSLYLARCTPATTFKLGAVSTPGEGHSGVYTAETFLPKTLGLMATVTDISTVKREYTSIVVSGNTAIAECTMRAKLHNGDDYYNEWANFIEFDGETGSITSVRMYGDTELGMKALQTAKK